MSEAYLTGRDSWQPLEGFNIYGQTFTPVIDHYVQWADVDLWFFSITKPEMGLIYCDDDHNPTGSIRVYADVVEPFFYLPPCQRRVRFRFRDPVHLVAGDIMALLLWRDKDHFGENNLWGFDRDDAQYPRGHLIFSEDGGWTWTHFPGHDFMFAEFGEPVSPIPPGNPPIDNFFPTDNQVIEDLVEKIVIITTNVPCHLFLYWTDIEPLKHPLTKLRRGKLVPWDTRWCFVSYHENEQLEAGDTLFHTFLKPEWIPCKHIWYTLRGNINTKRCPSVGPIFKYHQPFGLLFAEHYTLIEWPPVGPLFHDEYTIIYPPTNFVLKFTEAYTW